MNYGYQPQFNYNPYYGQYGYQNIQQLQNQQQVVPPIQNVQPQQQIQTQSTSQNMLQGWYVDSFDVTKAINADMSGSAMFFPSTDGKEIYKKQLDINTGKSDTLIYKLSNPSTQIEEKHTEIDFSQVYECIEDVKRELMDNMSEIKEMVLDSITTPSPASVSTKSYRSGGGR